MFNMKVNLNIFMILCNLHDSFLLQQILLTTVKNNFETLKWNGLLISNLWNGVFTEWSTFYKIKLKMGDIYR